MDYCKNHLQQLKMYEEDWDTGQWDNDLCIGGIENFDAEKMYISVETCDKKQ